MSYGSGQYLGIEGDISNAQNGTKVVAVTSPFAWRVEDSDISGIQGIRCAYLFILLCVIFYFDRMARQGIGPWYEFQPRPEWWKFGRFHQGSALGKVERFQSDLGLQRDRVSGMWIL
jgi:hypothetical protein